MKIDMIQFLIGLLARIGALFRECPKTSAATGSAAVLIAAAAFVGPWEGERTEAYLDRIASGATFREIGRYLNRSTSHVYSVPGRLA